MHKGKQLEPFSTAFSHLHPTLFYSLSRQTDRSTISNVPNKYVQAMFATQPPCGSDREPTPAVEVGPCFSTNLERSVCGVLPRGTWSALECLRRVENEERICFYDSSSDGYETRWIWFAWKLARLSVPPISEDSSIVIIHPCDGTHSTIMLLSQKVMAVRVFALV